MRVFFFFFVYNFDISIVFYVTVHYTQDIDKAPGLMENTEIKKIPIHCYPGSAWVPFLNRCIATTVVT